MIYNYWLTLSGGTSNIQSQYKVVQHRDYNLPSITVTLLIRPMSTMLAASAPANGLTINQQLINGYTVGIQ